jgi:hypothetical protein
MWAETDNAPETGGTLRVDRVGLPRRASLSQELTVGDLLFTQTVHQTFQFVTQSMKRRRGRRCLGQNNKVFFGWQCQFSTCVAQPPFQTIPQYRLAESLAHNKDGASGVAANAYPKQLTLRPWHCDRPCQRRFGSNGKAFAAPATAAIQYGAATGSLHTLAESVLILPTTTTGLVSTLHWMGLGLR